MEKVSELNEKNPVHGDFLSEMTMKANRNNRAIVVFPDAYGKAILELENVNSDISDSTLIAISDVEQLLQHAFAHILRHRR